MAQMMLSAAFLAVLAGSALSIVRDLNRPIG